MDISEDIKERIITQTISFAKDRMKGLAPSHGWDHVERVMELANKIAEVENADPLIVVLSAILHDIARKEGDKNKGMTCHAELGGEIAKDFLLKQNINEESVNKIAQCIKSHRYRNSHVPESKEAKVIYDADKLDSIGAVGLGRAFLFAGEVGAKLHNPDADISKTKAFTIEDTAYREFKVKLQHVKNSMLTNEGKRLAQSRHEFMINFFKRLDEEISGSI